MFCSGQIQSDAMHLTAPCRPIQHWFGKHQDLTDKLDLTLCSFFTSFSLFQVAYLSDRSIQVQNVYAWCQMLVHSRAKQVLCQIAPGISNNWQSSLPITLTDLSKCFFLSQTSRTLTEGWTSDFFNILVDALDKCDHWTNPRMTDAILTSWLP